MNRRFLFLNTLAIASLALGVACNGDDGKADGAGTNASDGSADDAPDDGDDAPDGGNEAPDTGTDTNPVGGTASGSGTDAPTATVGTADDTTGDSDDTTGVPACPYDVVEGNPAFAWELVADNFDRPMMAIGDPVQPDRLFVVEQGGAVKILEPGMSSAPAENFLEVNSVGAGATMVGNEAGTLGFAFHPDWPSDGRVYISYNPPGGNTRIAEYQVDATDGSVADPGSARTILELDQPAGNHNGGMIMFGPDGYLYIGLGDGGGGGDQYNTSRNANQVLSKMLRIGVEPDGSPDDPEACNACQSQGPFDYTIPPDNPGVDGTRPGWAPEIFAMGLRNPWRFAMDPENGDIYVADVGQGAWEEVDIVTRGGDYGWNDMEGNHCYGGGGCDAGGGPNTENADGQIIPIYEYGSNDGPGDCASITGGAVYRSCQVPDWDGVYVFGEYCHEFTRALRWDGTSTEYLGPVPNNEEPVTGNGFNAWGDVYMTTAGSNPYGPIGNGKVYRLAPA